MKNQLSTALFLVLFLMAAGFLMAGGSREEGAGEEPSFTLSEPGVTPLVDEKVTLTCFAVLTSEVNSYEYEDNSFTKYMEDLTNVHIDWQVVTQADAKTKLNLIIASGEYPDIFLHPPGWDLTQLQVLAGENVIIPLDKYIEESGVYTRPIYKRFPRLKRIITLPDGNIYSMPAVTGAYHAQAQAKMWVYKPWLDKLGLDIPETTEEFRDMLRAFKTQDPNGNGIADEIPLAGAYDNWYGDIDVFLMNAFVYTDDNKRLSYKNGEIVTAYDTDEWRDGLKYMKSLFDEGLLGVESFIQTGDQLRQLANSETMILGCAPGGAQGMFIQVGEEYDRWRDYVTIPPLMGPNGVRTTPYVADMGLTDRIVEVAISSTCQYPELAFRWADIQYKNEVTMRSQWGIEGVNYEYVDENSGILGINGEPALFKTLSVDPSERINSNWANNNPRYGYFEDYHSRQADNPLLPVEEILYSATEENYMPYVPPKEEVVPILAFDFDVVGEVGEIESMLKTYVKEMIARFVIGDADIDTEWDSYLRELDNMGLQRYKDLYNAAYDKNMN